MGLIAWFPLNGNLNNQGSNTTQLTNSSATFNSLGKVTSKSLTLNSTASSTGYFKELTTQSTHQAFSFSFWFKGIAEAATAWSDLLSFWTTSGSSQAQLRVELTATTSTGSGTINLFNNGHWTYDGGFGEMAYDTNWHHYTYVLTYNQCLGYRDGNLQFTTLKENIGTYYLSGNFRIGDTEQSRGYLNDIRIYDHALSTKEVKQLSKGLCLHYTFNFNDLYTKIDYLQATGSQYIDTEYYFDSADKYPIACEFTCSTNDSTGVNLPVGGCGNSSWAEPIMLNFCSNKLEFGTGEYCSSGSYTPGNIYDYNFYSQNNWQYWSQQCETVMIRNHAAVYNSNHFYLFMMNNAYFQGKLYSFKLYSNKKLVRDFIPCIRNYDSKPGLFDRIENKFYVNQGSGSDFTVPTTKIDDTIWDRSYYGNNGIASSGVILTSSTILGNQGITFPNGTDYISFSRPFCNVSPSELTIACWTNVSSSNGGYSILTSNYDSPASGFWLATNCEGSGLWYYNSGLYIRGSVTVSTGWHFIALTYNNGTYQWYLDGNAVITTLSGTTKAPSLATTLALGNSYTGSSWNTKRYDSIADFKIFATALSANDILQMYSNKAEIDNEKNIFCECLETNYSGEAVFPTKTGIIKCGDAFLNNYETMICDYTVLDYIKSTGTQYIDTSITANNNIAIEVKHYTSTNTSVYGSTTGLNYTSNDTYPGGYFYYWNRSTTGAGGASTNRDIMTVKQDNNLCYRDGSLVYTYGTTTFEDSQSIWLFGRNNYGTLDDAGTTQIYYCKIWSGGDLIMYLIPVKRNSDGRIGMYDLVWNEFLTNPAGTGEFEYYNNIETAAPIIKCNNLYENGGFNVRPYSANDYDLFKPYTLLVEQNNCTFNVNRISSRVPGASIGTLVKAGQSVYSSAIIYVGDVLTITDLTATEGYINPSYSGFVSGDAVTGDVTITSTASNNYKAVTLTAGTGIDSSHLMYYQIGSETLHTAQLSTTILVPNGSTLRLGGYYNGKYYQTDYYTYSFLPSSKTIKYQTANATLSDSVQIPHSGDLTTTGKVTYSAVSISSPSARITVDSGGFMEPELTINGTSVEYEVSGIKDSQGIIYITVSKTGFWS